MSARGALRIIDQGVPDEKILAVAVSSPVHKSICNHKDLDPHVLREIEHFFSVYKNLEGKETKINGWADAVRAQRLIVSSHQQFEANAKSSKD
jgi:inorganic pyrophosphatase